MAETLYCRNSLQSVLKIAFSHLRYIVSLAVAVIENNNDYSKTLVKNDYKIVEINREHAHI